MKPDLTPILPSDKSWRGATIESAKAKIHLERSKHGVGIWVLPIAPPQTDAIDFWRNGFKTETCRSLAKCLRDRSSFRMGEFSATRIERGVRIDLGYKDLGREAFSVLLLDDDFDFFMAILDDNYLTIKSMSRLNETGGQVRPGKVGRNDPCPCGSGKKSKKCCRMESLQASEQTESSALGREIDRLNEIGLEFASHGRLSDARNAFESAARLHPNSYGSQLNAAVVMAQQGEVEKAIQLVQGIPSFVQRRAAILANLFQDQQRHSDAVLCYEIAIEEEPDFYLPYARIINSLKALESSTIEYWLRLGMARMPYSAELGFQFANLLFHEGRHEDLAEADFVDLLQVSENRLEVFGSGSNDELLIQKARLLQLASRAIKRESAEDSATFIDAFLSSPATLETCELAKVAVGIAVSFGMPETTEKCWNRICQDCIRSFLDGGTSINTILTQTHLASARYEEVVSHAEEALKVNEHDEASLAALWYALDELGRLDDAITRAHQLFRLNPNHENVAYSLGWLYKKLGRYPTAAYHYDFQLAHQPDHHHAAKSSSLMHLLCGEADIAKGAWAGYESILEKLLSECDGVQIDLGEVIDSSSFLQKEQANWQALLDRALSESSPETRLADLVDLMEKLFGVDAGFPPRPLSTLEIYRSLQVPDSVEAMEARFNLQLQAVGDSSILIAQIKNELPGWGKLPPSAQYSMIEAQKRISSQEVARDFSPYVVALASAVEKTMKILIFEAFRSSRSLDIVSREQLLQASPEDQEKLKRFTAFLFKGNFLELGGMENVLKLLTGRTARRVLILQRLNTFLIDGGFGALTTQPVLDALAAMTKSRNSAAHSDSLTREDALRVKGEVLTVLGALVPM